MRGRRHTIFIQWLEGCSCGTPGPRHGIVRLYPKPHAVLISGLPAQPWDWSCNFTIKNGYATLHAALTAPPDGSLRLLLDQARGLGINVLSWERVERDGVRAVSFSL